MTVDYFKNDKVNFQEQRFSSEGISSKHINCSKAKNFLGLEAKINESKTTLFPPTLNFEKIKYPYCQAQPKPQLSWAEWLYFQLIQPPGKVYFSAGANLVSKVKQIR